MAPKKRTVAFPVSSSAILQPTIPVPLRVLAGTRSDSWCLVERSGLVSVPLSRDHFLLRHRHCIQEGLHRGLAEAPTALMWSCLIVLFDPRVQVGLQFVD